LERVEVRERTVPKETLVKRSREVIAYTNSTIADSVKDFEPNDYITLGEPLLKPNDRIKYIITTDPNSRDIEREFEFIILDSQNYELWVGGNAHDAYYKSPKPTIELNDAWTVPANSGIQQYRVILSNRLFAYPKRITYTVIKQESFVTRQEYLETVIENVTETYEERVPYQELQTVTKQETCIIIGLLTNAQKEKIKRIPGIKQITRTTTGPEILPKCPLCGSRVVPTHIVENRKKIYKCTYCNHLLELD